MTALGRPKPRLSLGCRVGTLTITQMRLRTGRGGFPIAGATPDSGWGKPEPRARTGYPMIRVTDLDAPNRVAAEGNGR